MLAGYSVIPERIERLGQGLVNLTLHVSCIDGQQFVLQRLNGIFDDRTNANIHRITQHLRGQNFATPELVRSARGELSVQAQSGLWRLLTHQPGDAYDSVISASHAAAAGSLLGRFHFALMGFSGELHSSASGGHNPTARVAALRDALQEGPAAPALADEVALHLERIEPALSALPEIPLVPRRLVHGDPKISNLLFTRDGADGLCMVDLDTLGFMPVPYEIGDAMRSWCNPLTEDAPNAYFDLDYFRAALKGYREGSRGMLQKAEWMAIVPATLAIYLELASRFLLDMIQDRFFGWDSRRYVSRTDHNRARALGQLAAFRSLQRQGPAAEKIVSNLL